MTLDFDFNEYQCMRWHEGSVPDWASGTGVLNIIWRTRPRTGSVMTTQGQEYSFADKPGPGESWTGYTPCYIPVNKHGKGSNTHITAASGILKAAWFAGGSTRRCGMCERVE